MTNFFRDRVLSDENATETTETPPETRSNTAHEIPDDLLTDGGVTLAAYNSANGETKTVGDLTVPALAYAATGSKDGDRDISDGERAMRARFVDESVRGFASFVQSRPVEERIEYANRPVIFVPSE